MSQSKKYIIEVATNKASLEKLRSDLLEATKLPKESVDAPALSREAKAQVKKDLATLFGVAEYQADALRKMMQAAADGFADGKSVEEMKNQLKETLEFTNSIMQKMQQMGDATSWMDRGITFVDDFIKMKDSIGSIKEVEKSLNGLSKTFEKFKDALAETNADAFLQRFGTSTRNDAQEFAAAQKELQRIAKNRTKAIKEILQTTPESDDSVDYSKKSKEEIEKIYRGQMDAIIDCNNEIQELRKKYKGNTKGLYNDVDYQDAIRDLVEARRVLDNLHGLGDGIGSDLRASMQIATDSVREAGNEIQNLVNKLKDKGIELAITLPDAASAKFAGEINKFVKEASKEFEGHPIEMTLDILTPFKKDAFSKQILKNGELQYKELSDKQKSLSKKIEDDFRENLKAEEIELDDDALKGLYNVNTKVIARNMTDAFNKLYTAMTSGQALLKSATKRWRESIEDDLTIRPRFETSTAKADLDTSMGELQESLTSPDMYLDVYADTDSLINGIQSALNKKTFDINVQAGDISGGNLVIQADGIKLSTADLIYESSGSEPAQPASTKKQETTTPEPKTSTHTQKPAAPPAPVQKQIASVDQNSTAVTDATRAQVVLTNAVNELNASIKSNDERNKMAEESAKQMQEQAKAHAEEIKNYEITASKQQERVDKLGAERREFTEKRDATTKKLDETKQRSLDLSKKLYDLLKAGNVEQFATEFQKIVDKLPEVRKDIEEEIRRVENNKDYSKEKKETLISNYASDIDVIDKILGGELSAQDKTQSGKRVYFAAIDAIFNHSINNLDALVTDFNTKISNLDTQIMNANTAVGNAHQRINELKNSAKIEQKEDSVEKRSDNTKLLQRRLDKINAVMEGNKDPITLVYDEVDKFWATCNKKISDAEQYIQKKEKEAGLDKLDKSSKEYRKKKTELEKKDKKYVSEQNTLKKWKQIEAEMRVTGLDIRGLSEQDALEHLREVLIGNSLLASSLGRKGSSLRGLKNIDELKYFIPEVQKTMGVTPRTETEYLSEQELRNNFKEALRVNEYIKTARKMLTDMDGDINPSSVQKFIDYFDGIPGMADAVEAASKYLESVKELPKEVWSDEDPKEYVEQIKDAWDIMDDASKNNFLTALNKTDAVGKTKVSTIDNWDLMYDKVLSAYSEGNSELKEIQSENPQLQQILSILQRASLLKDTRDAANSYGEHGILSALFGMQKSKLVGNASVPKDPIHLTAVDKNGKEHVYKLGAGKSTKATDGRFSYKPESFRSIFNRAGVTDQIDEIVGAIFNPALVATTALETDIRELQSEISVLESFNYSDEESKKDSRKKVRGLSYRAFDGTSMENDWHQMKDVVAEVLAVQDILNKDLNVDRFPDGLWKNIKGLRKQKGLEREIRELESGLKTGAYSDEVKKQLKGLDEKESKQKVREMIDSKKTELETVKGKNKNVLQTVLASKLKQLESLEDQIISKTQEVIDTKKAELTTKQNELNDLKPLRDEANKAVDALIQSLLDSGKIRLSHGKEAEEADWAGKYKFEDSKLAQYEKQKEINDREIARLNSEIARVNAGEHDNEIKKSLLKAKLPENVEEIQGLKDSEINKYLLDKGLAKDEAEIKGIIAEKRKQIVAQYQSTIQQLSELAITPEEVIESLLALEDDIKLDYKKAEHAKDQAKTHRTKSKSLDGKKKFDVYSKEKKKHRDAVWDEARSAYGGAQGTSQESVDKFNNLLTRIQFAKKHGLMDTTELEKLVEKYEETVEEFNNTEDLKAQGKAKTDDVDAARKRVREAQAALVNKFFDTDGWFRTQQLEEQFAIIDGELQREVNAERSKAASKNDNISSQMDAVNQQKEKDEGLVNRYVDALREEYLIKPRESIRKALEAEVEKINAARKQQNVDEADVERRAENDKELQDERIKLTEELKKDPRYIALKKQREQLNEFRDELLNDPEFQALLAEEAELKKNKQLGTTRGKAVREKIRLGLKGIGADGKPTKEAQDLTEAINAIEKEYSLKFKEIREKWISDEIEKIRQGSFDTSSYSKNAVDIWNAQYVRDQNIDDLRKKARENQDVLAEKDKIKTELASNEKYLDLLKEYDALEKQGKQNTEAGKTVSEKIKTIKQKYEQRMVDAENKWIEAQTKRINDTFNSFVEAIVDESVNSQQNNLDYMTVLTARKKNIINRLIKDNAEFSNLVDSVKGEKGVTKKDGSFDYNKLTKELMKKGIPDGLVTTNDLMVLSDTGVRKSDDLEKHLATLQKSLNKKIKAIIDNAIQQIDDSDLVSDDELQAEIEKIRAKKEKEKQEKLEAIRNRTDRELLSTRHDEQVDIYEDQVDDYETAAEQKDAALKAYQRKYGYSDDVLAAAREKTLIYKQIADEEQAAADAIDKSNEAAKEVVEQTSKRTTTLKQGGTTTAGAGFVLPSLIGAFNTSDLAKEGTLRGIYEVLNGGEPKGGWDDSISESSKMHENQGGALSANNVLGPAKSIADLVKSLMVSAKELPTELLTLLGNKSILKQESSGERGFIAMEDVYRAITGTKGSIKAALHNHPNGNALMSKSDIKEFLDLAYDKNTPSNKRIKVHGAYSDTELSSLNFTGIPENIAKKIIDDTFKTFETVVDSFDLRYDEKEQKYYDKNNKALDYKNAEDLQAMKFLENVFYTSLRENFEKHGFNQAFQFIDNIDQLDDWVATITESASSIKERAKQNVVTEKTAKEAPSVKKPTTATTEVANEVTEAGSQAAVESAKTTPAPEVSSQPVQAAADQVAEAIVEAGAQAALQAVNGGSQDANKSKQTFFINPNGPLGAHYTNNGVYEFERTMKMADMLGQQAAQFEKFGVYGFGYGSRGVGKTAFHFDTKDPSLESDLYDYLLKQGHLVTEDQIDFEVAQYIQSLLQRHKDGNIQENTQEYALVQDYFDGKLSHINFPIEASVVQESAQQATEAIVEAAGKAAITSATTTTPEAPTQQVNEAASRVADEIVENASDAVKAGATSGSATQPKELSDVYSIYKDLLGNLGFENIAKGKINEVRTLMMELMFMGIDTGMYSDILKETTSGKNITAISDDLYKIPEMRAKIVDSILDCFEVVLGSNGLKDAFDTAGKDNIRQYIDGILPNAVGNVAKNVIDSGVKAAEDATDGKKQKGKSKKKTTPEKQEPTEQPNVPDATVQEEKGAEAAQATAAANKATTAEKERQAQLSAEIAQNENEAAGATKKQADATSETAQNQKEQVSSNMPTSRIPSYEHNYKLGLGGLAQESTLSSILGAINSGIKVKSDKGGSGGGKRGGKKKSDDKPLNVTAEDAWVTAQDYIKANYPGFTSLSSLRPVSGGYAIDVFRPNDLEAYAAAQKRVNDLIAAGKQETEEFTQAQTELNKLKFEQEKITLKIGHLNDKVQVTQAKTSFQNIAVGVKAAAKELQTVEDILVQLHDIGTLTVGDDGGYDSSIGSVKKYVEALKNLNTYRNSLSPDQLFDPIANQKLSELALKLQSSRKEMMALIKTSSQLNIGEKIETDKLSDGIEGLSDSEVKQVMKDIIDSSTTMETKFKDASRVTNEFGEVIGYQLAYTVRTGKHEVQEMTAVLNPLTNELRVQKGAIKDAETGWKAFFTGLKGKAASIMQYLMSITSIHDVFRYFSQGVQYVRDIDAALTELKKVTDETDASYARFLQDMSRTGGEIGATVADLTSSAADWARLNI